MHVGISIATEPRPGEKPTAVVDRLTAQVRHADRWGFESCFFTEHHQQPDGHFPSPLVVMAALSSVTSRIRLGSAVILAPLYDPIRLAEDIALIDIFSKGRVVVGVGTGYTPVDFDAFSMDRRQRGKRTDEILDVLKLAWAEEAFDYAGDHYRYHNVNITPKPAQVGGPPVWIGGLSEAAIRRAVRAGDGWVSTFVAQLPQVASLARRYRGVCRENNRSGEVTLLREAWVASSRAAAYTQYEEAALSTHRLYWELGRYSSDPRLDHVTSASELRLAMIAEDRFILGSVDECIAEIKRYQAEADVDRVVLRLGHPDGPGHEEIMDVIELIGQEVIPNV